MNSSVQRIGIILSASAVVAVVANSMHPRRIPWVRDWSHQVEAKAAEQKIPVIPLSVAREKLSSGSAVFVDARSASEFAKGHIPGAISIPFEHLGDDYATIDDLIGSGRELVVYCKNRDCDDALLFVSELQKMGCNKAVLYIDGFDAWKRFGGKVEP